LPVIQTAWWALVAFTVVTFFVAICYAGVPGASIKKVLLESCAQYGFIYSFVTLTKSIPDNFHWTQQIHEGEKIILGWFGWWVTLPVMIVMILSLTFAITKRAPVLGRIVFGYSLALLCVLTWAAIRLLNGSQPNPYVINPDLWHAELFPGNLWAYWGIVVASLALCYWASAQLLEVPFKLWGPFYLATLCSGVLVWMGYQMLFPALNLPGSDPELYQKLPWLCIGIAMLAGVGLGTMIALIRKARRAASN
jgi:hypothetical protein